MVVSQGELARRIGVSAMAISKAVAAGKLTRTAEGIDLKAQKTIDYLARSKHQRRYGKKQHRRPAVVKKAHPAKQKAPASKRGRKKTTRRAHDKDSIGGELELNGETYHEADLRKTIAQADKVEQEIAIRRGELVERTDVKLVFSRVYQVIGSQVKTLSEKLGPAVAAAFGLTEDAVPRVQEIMSIDILRALSGIKGEFNAYLDSIGEELVEEVNNADPA